MTGFTPELDSSSSHETARVIKVKKSSVRLAEHKNATLNFPNSI